MVAELQINVPSMRKDALYAQLLKLSFPRHITSVTPDELEKVVIVRDGVRARARLVFP